MAKRKKSGFDFSALQKYGERLEELGGTDALKRAAQAGLIAAKQEINKTVAAAMSTSNLPAGGKYSTGETLESLDRSMAVAWSGNIAYLPLGFNWADSGITSFLLLHGTPKMKPVAGLAEALSGKSARTKARKAQEEAMRKIIERLGG